jgi:hypothetical protein
MVERHTRLPHDPEYTALLGAAVYAFAYTEWMLMEILRSLEPDATHASLAELTSGQVAAQLRTAIEKLPQEEGREIGKRFAALVERRIDMIHAHPATAADGAQRLPVGPAQVSVRAVVRRNRSGVHRGRRGP